MASFDENRELAGNGGRRSGGDGIMGILSNKIDKNDLKSGDHIYCGGLPTPMPTTNQFACGLPICKIFFVGIYIGNGEIVHYTRAAGQETGTGTVIDRLFVSSSPATGIPCERCGDQSNLQGVLLSCIDCFLAGGVLRLFQYSSSPALFIAQARGGTCTLAHSDPTEDVLHRANYLLLNGFGTYSLFKNNCEDFAIYCKTGLLYTRNFGIGRSGQIGSFLAAAASMASSSGALIASAMYFANRLVSDIGVRRDVVKVDVEDLELYKQLLLELKFEVKDLELNHQFFNGAMA